MRIALDSCDLLSRLFFVEMRVELELSSGSVGQVGGNFSFRLYLLTIKGNLTFPGKDTSLFCLEFDR